MLKATLALGMSAISGGMATTDTGEERGTERQKNYAKTKATPAPDTDTRYKGERRRRRRTVAPTVRREVEREDKRLVLQARAACYTQKVEVCNL